MSPWWAFGIDALVILALLVGRPTLREGNDPIGSALRRDFRPTLATAFLFACAIGATSFGTNHAYGSLDAALARLRGERVSIEPTWVDVGNGAAGEVKDVSFEIRNWTDRTVRVIGGTADCSCRVAGEMPLDVPPGEKRSLTISVRLPASAGIFSRPAHLLVDDGGHLAKIPFDVSGRVQ